MRRGKTRSATTPGGRTAAPVARQRAQAVARIAVTRSAAATALALAGLALAGEPAKAADRFVPGEVVVGFEDGGTRTVELPDRTPVRRAASALERAPTVEFAQPNWIARASLAPLDRGTSGEPGGWQADQWSLLGRPGGIRVNKAWNRAIEAGADGGSGTTVAVVDTGIAYASSPGGFEMAPDFAGTRFVAGTDLVDDDDLPLDENGHGTHVAGTIAEQVTLDRPSAGDDYLTGIGYGAALMPVRVLDAKGVGSATDVAQGILFAARNGADVINVSLQFDAAVKRCEDVPTVCAATRKAKRLGALVVAAAGNAADGKGKSRALYPAAAPGALAVAATTEHGCLAAYSHFGKRTDLLAPGGGEPRGKASSETCIGDLRPVLQLTLECFPQNCSDYRRFAIRSDIGTSMAAAHASGVAALVRASRVAGSNPSAAKLAKRLKCTARDGAPKRFYGPGSLDANRATDPGRACARR